MDDKKMEITCENCGSRTKKDLGWLKDHNEFECGCGTMIAVDASKYHKGSRTPSPGLMGPRG